MNEAENYKILQSSYRQIVSNRLFWDEICGRIMNDNPECVKLLKGDNSVRNQIMEAVDTLMWYSLDCCSANNKWGHYLKFMRNLPAITCLNHLSPYVVWKWRDLMINIMPAYDKTPDIGRLWSDALHKGVDLIIATSLNRQIQNVS